MKHHPLHRPASHTAAGPLTFFSLSAVLLSALCMLLWVAPVSAQSDTETPPGEAVNGQMQGDAVQIVVTGDGRTQVRLAIPQPDYDPGLSGAFLDAAREVEQTLRDDLQSDTLFNTQGPTELSVLTLTGQRAHDFEQYQSLGNDVVLLVSLKREDDRIVLDGWAYDLPSQQSILGKRYRGTVQQARLVAHYLSEALHRQFQGRPGLFLTSLAFHSQRDGFQELYLMDYDGRNQRKISAHKSISGYADWSGTGDAIAYISYYSDAPGIYYVDLDSSQKIPVYREGTLNLSPSFSPDGQRIAFAHSRSSNVDIYICSRDNCTDPTRITDSAGIDTNPSWSPDGNQIAFTSSRSGRPNIYVMDTKGGNVRRISFEGDYNDGATWNPNAPEIAYASRENNRFRIAVTNLVDLSTRITAQGSESYEEPTFSPDGQRLAFTVRRGKEAQIFVMNADGSNWRQLTHEGTNSAPDWSGFAKE